MQTFLQEVRIRNFKLFDKAGIAVKPGRITVFIGPNGTGKSSVLQALVLLKQSLGRDRMELDGPVLRLGTLRDVLHGQDPSLVLGMEVEVGFKDFTFDLRVSPELPHEGRFTYRVEFADGRVVLNSGAVAGPSGTSVLAGEWQEGGASAQPSKLEVDNNIQVNLVSSSTVGSPIWYSGMSYPGNEYGAKANYVASQLRQLLSTADVVLKRTFLVPPIRGFDRLAYPTMEAAPADDLTAANGPNEQARSTVNLLAYEPDYSDEISDWLQRVLPSSPPRRLRTRLAAGSTIAGESTGGPISINLVNDAFGRNRLVSPLLWLARSPAGSIIGIEEPEIHLHPRAQAALSDIFVDVACAEDKQVVLITHSEHILMGLLAAVAKGSLAPDELAVYEFQREGDTARVDRLEVNEDGQIEGGLSGFLEVELDEIGSLLAARFPKVKA